MGFLLLKQMDNDERRTKLSGVVDHQSHHRMGDDVRVRELLSLSLSPLLHMRLE
jgi:hypothetical protein